MLAGMHQQQVQPNLNLGRLAVSQREEVVS